MKHIPSACPKRGIIPGRYSILHRNSKKFLLGEDPQQIRNVKRLCGMEGAGRGPSCAVPPARSPRHSGLLAAHELLKAGSDLF